MPDDPGTQDERRLVEQAARGDAEAFAALYRRHWALVLCAAARELPDPGEAENVAQETFTQAWRGVRALREPGAFPAFLQTIAGRLARDARQRPRPIATGAPPDRPDPAAGPARLAQRAEFDRALAAALAEFAPLPRQAVLLRLAEGLKYREIAGRLGLTLGQTTGLVDRGILRLADLLREHLGGAAP